MPILGCHMSIAGGRHRAVERAAAVGCDCVQLFTGNPRAFPTFPVRLRSGKSLTKNNHQRSAKDITSDEAQRFCETLTELGVTHPIAHDSYLINLASPDAGLWRKSVAAFVAELCRADLLDIPYVVTHPGAYTAGSEESGLRNVIRAIDEIHAQSRDLQARCLIETTAGQGTSLGWRFEHLARIIDGVKRPDWLGVCFDTCHVFAAGYGLETPKNYKATMGQFDRLVGLDRIKAFHLNDSRRERGSRIDRHEHIGRGKLGLEPFRLLLADRRFRDVPMYLETPKGEEDGVDWDVVNLSVLRGLL